MENKPKTRYIGSEEYRQMLVRDGEKRFHEWHTKFLNYQKKFVEEISSKP
jgi:hypothetical protein